MPGKVSHSCPTITLQRECQSSICINSCSTRRICDKSLSNIIIIIVKSITSNWILTNHYVLVRLHIFNGKPRHPGRYIHHYTTCSYLCSINPNRQPNIFRFTWGNSKRICFPPSYTIWSTIYNTTFSITSNAICLHMCFIVEHNL